MAQVGLCPQCDSDLSVPDGVSESAWTRCPNCRAFFQLKDARPHEVSSLEIINSQAAAEEYEANKTVSDFSSMATWDGEAPEVPQLHIAEEPEQPEPFERKGLIENELDASDGDYIDEFETTASAADDQHPNKSALEDDEYAIKAPPSETAESETPAPVTAESPEAAAERIDAWFRSAKTLPDVPPLDEVASAYEGEPIGAPAAGDNNATVEMDSDALAELNNLDELDLSDDLKSDSPQDVAAWDDSQHMDRLLAEFDSVPTDDEYKVEEPVAATPAEQHADAEGWVPKEPVSIVTPAARPRGSFLRTALFTVVGGVVGLGLGYYVLLWLRGPAIDSLNLAKYLPKAMLPASFKTEPKPIVAKTPVETPSEPVEAPAKIVAPPAEKQATYSTPKQPDKTGATSDDRYGATTTTAKAPAEPALLAAPPATPIAAGTAHINTVRLVGAPSFTAEEVTFAVEAATNAKAGLVNGDLTDGKEVQHTKGVSYAALADLAQKATNIDKNTSPDKVAKLEQEADDVFRQTLASKHTRAEVGQIVPKWIASPNRKNTGVFAAGNFATHTSQGTVNECSVDLGGGATLTVLVPADMAQQLADPGRPVIFVGSIVDKPAEQVTGYTGRSSQAVLATRLIPLE